MSLKQPSPFTGTQHFNSLNKQSPSELIHQPPQRARAGLTSSKARAGASSGCSVLAGPQPSAASSGAEG